MCLHYSLNESENSLVNKFWKTQMEKPSKTDWINFVMKDLEFRVFLSYTEIRLLSTAQFKNLVDESTVKKALEHLNQTKLKHSKVLHIRHDTLSLQPYLCPQYVWNTQLSKFLFQARARMSELRANFQQKHFRNGFDCELGCSEVDCQEHLLSCIKILDSSLATTTLPNYEDLFSTDVDIQLRLSAIMNERMMKGKNIVNQD